MPRKPRTKAETPSNLLNALKFVSAITKDSGSVNDTHVSLQNNWAITFNSVIAMGHPIQEEISCCPNNKLMIEALSKCGQNIAYTQLDNDRLSIKSDKFKAIIPCINTALYEVGIPDVNIAPINDNFKKGLEVVGVLASENAQTVICASILMNGHSLLSTNRHVVFEYWHGNSLPTNICLPKALVGPLTKTNKKLVGFGCSNNSVTFHFEDGCWIKSQLFAETWPDIGRILEGPVNPFPIPKDFFLAVDALTPFTDDGWLYFDAGVLRSALANEAASYEVAGLPKGPVYPAKQLSLIKDLADKIDFIAHDSFNRNVLKFFGPNVRGVIAGRG